MFVNSDYESLTNNNIKGNTYITTLAENKEFFTPRQFERAKKARYLFHAVGTVDTRHSSSTSYESD